MTRIQNLHNRRIAVLFALFTCLMTANFVHAQTTAFTYQGRLTDGTAQANGNYDMEFRLFDSPTVGSGTQIGATQIRSAVQVTSSIFTVQLSFGDADIYDTTRLYLEIKVKPAGSGASLTTLSPRQQVTSAPTAIQARNAKTADNAFSADRLDGTPAADFAMISDLRFTDARTPTAGSNFYIQNNSSAIGQTGDFYITGLGRVGSLTVNNNISFGGFISGNGQALSSLSATNISSGTLDPARISGLDAGKITSGTFPDLRLSSNIPRLNAANVFTGAQTTFNNTNGLVAVGTVGSGTIPQTGAGGRMMWYAGKNAFRAGRVLSAQWDDANIGNYSVAFNYNTTASGDSATAIGYNTDASGSFSFAAGDQTLASGAASTALGAGTTASGLRSTAMGNSSVASGLSSTAMGSTSIASGDLSTALGFQASTNNQYGSFVISDASSTGIVKAIVPNQFVVGAQKIWLGQGNAVTSTPGRYIETSTGAYLSTSGVWTDNSSRFLKTSFSAVDSRAVLQKVLSLPIQTWSYKTDSPDVRHIGVMAQDFYREFKVGADDEHITAVDTAGVAMSAIQGLNAELEERTTKLQTENDVLRKTTERQQKQLDALMKFICAANPSADICREK